MKKVIGNSATPGGSGVIMVVHYVGALPSLTLKLGDRRFFKAHKKKSVSLCTQ